VSWVLLVLAFRSSPLNKLWQASQRTSYARFVGSSMIAKVTEFKIHFKCVEQSQAMGFVDSLRPLSNDQYFEL
jgi:hypothetical protein